MRIKIFSDSRVYDQSPCDLEYDVNEWLEDNSDIKVTDIKMHSFVGSRPQICKEDNVDKQNMHHYLSLNVLVIYEPPTE